MRRVRGDISVRIPQTKAEGAGRAAVHVPHPEGRSETSSTANLQRSSYPLLMETLAALNGVWKTQRET